MIVIKYNLLHFLNFLFANTELNTSITTRPCNIFFLMTYFFNVLRYYKLTSLTSISCCPSGSGNSKTDVVTGNMDGDSITTDGNMGMEIGLTFPCRKHVFTHSNE
jgi:hypothetical protein